MSFPFSINSVEKHLNERLVQDFRGERTGFVQVGDKKFLLQSKYAEEADGHYNIALRKDDLWIVTFPRSGTTWTQELLWLVNNDLDYETAGKTQLFDRFPFNEFSLFMHKEVKEEIIAQNPGNEEVVKTLDVMVTPGYEKLLSQPSPRYIKTHLPLSLLPPNLLDTCKTVYVARNPKDVAVSYYHLSRLLHFIGYEKDFPTYWEYFKKNLVVYTPYWEHILEGWRQRNHPNLLFLFYEELTKDMPGCIEKVAKFLGKNITAQQVHKLADHLHISNFKKNPTVYPVPVVNAKGFDKKGEEADFVRKGGIGGSKDYFTPEMNKDADKWIEEHLKNTDLKFPK